MTMPDEMQANVRLDRACDGALNPRWPQGLVGPILTGLCRTVRSAPGGEWPQTEQRVQANSDGNTQKEAYELSDRFHRLPVYRHECPTAASNPQYPTF